MQTLGLIIVYCMGNIGAIALLRTREARTSSTSGCTSSSRSLTTVALIWVFWKNVETLHPFSPKNAFDYSPLLVIIWTVVGLAILLIASRTGKEDWLRRAGESVQLRAETAAEAAHGRRCSPRLADAAGRRDALPAATAMTTETKRRDLAGLGIAVTGAAGDIGGAMALELAAPRRAA